MNNTSTTKPRDSLLVLCGLVLITACLYWARQVLIPVAVAVLLAFILTPAVSALQRRGLGRLPSVLLVVLLALALVSGAGYVISRQLDVLLRNVSSYENEIVNKIKALRGVGEGGFFGRLEHSWEDISEKAKPKKQPKGSNKAEGTDKESSDSNKNESEGEAGRDTGNDSTGNKSAKNKDKSEEPPPGADPSNPLYVQMASSGWLRVAEAIGPAAEGLGDAFLILVLVVFMLIQRENLRNRLVRLMGHGRLIVTTQAFDEGAQRISRYLLMQLAINTFFGVILTLGLGGMGLISGHRVLWQYALLWGFIAGTLRFVPYVGTWIAAALVTGFSIATLPGWTLPLAVLGFFLVIELLTANAIEPLLFGHSTGVSPLALLLAATFWTWLWGPVGLILSTPLTVILVVLGKYVPELHFFEVLLGDEPVLSADVKYYQRLVARDLDEATELVEEYGRDREPEAVYEDVLLPTLLHARRDHERDELDADSYQLVLQGICDTEEDLASALAERRKEAPSVSKVVAVGCPGRDEADEAALRMLDQMMRLSGYALEVISATKLTAEVLAHLEEEKPVVVCVGSLAPAGLSQARYQCKRIRQHLPNVKIVVGRWGEKDNFERVEKRLLAAGADSVARTLRDCRAQIVPLLQAAANALPAESNRDALVSTP